MVQRFYRGRFVQLRDLESRVHDFVWRPESTEVSWWRASVTTTLRIIYGVVRDLHEGQMTLRAMSLVYTTLLSLVPLLAISFSVLKGFGVHDQIEPFLLNLLAPLGDKAAETTQKIVEFVDNTRVAVLGIVGFVLLFYTVVSLMHKIESAFNQVWHVSSQRSLGERVRDYLSVIVIGPVLIFASLGIIASLFSTPVMAQLAAIQPFGWILETVSRLLPTVMVVAAFTLIYMFIPNTAVQTRSALVGGIVSGILWNGLGWLFAAFVATSTNYTAIYSGFATPIVFMIWLYLGWLILLTGSNIAFYHQHPEYVAGAGVAVEPGNRAREQLALLVLCAVTREFYDKRPAWSAEELAQAFKVPMQVLQPMLGILERGGLLGTTGDDPPRYLPGRPFETTSVVDVLELVRGQGVGQLAPPGAVISDATVDRLMGKVDQALAGALDGLTLKDLALAQPPAAENEAASRPQPVTAAAAAPGDRASA